MQKLDIFLVLIYFIIEERKAEYLITVVTGNKEGAGTDASASVVIKGTQILLLVFTVTPTKINSKSFNRQLNRQGPESGKSEKVNACKDSGRCNFSYERC